MRHPTSLWLWLSLAILGACLGNTHTLSIFGAWNNSAHDGANYLFLKPVPVASNPALFHLTATSSFVSDIHSDQKDGPSDLVHDYYTGKVRFELWTVDHNDQTQERIPAAIVAQGKSLVLCPLSEVPEGAKFVARISWHRLHHKNQQIPVPFDFPLIAPHELVF